MKIVVRFIVILVLFNLIGFKSTYGQKFYKFPFSGPLESNNFRCVKQIGDSLIIGGGISIVNGVESGGTFSWDGTDFFYNGIGNGTADVIEYDGNLFYGGGTSNIGGNLDWDKYLEWDGYEYFHNGQDINSEIESFEVFHDTLFVSGGVLETADYPSERVMFYVNGQFHNMPSIVGTLADVLDLEVFQDNLYAGCRFALNEVDMEPLHGVARWTGSGWENVGGGFNGHVYDLEVDEENGVMYAAGLFSFAGDSFAPCVAYWDGNTWTGLGNFMFNSYIRDLEIYRGQIYIGGFFDNTGEPPYVQTAAFWDGYQWRELDTGFAEGNVVDMEVYNDTLFIAGGFDMNDTTLAHDTSQSTRLIKYFVHPDSVIWGNGYEAELEDLVSVSNQKIEDQITIFPNPNKGQFTIQLPEEHPFQRVKCVNHLGKLIREDEIQSIYEINFDYPSLPKGSYSLIFISKEKIEVRKAFIVD